MHSEVLKLLFYKLNQIKILFVQMKKFVRFKAIMFHTVTCIWHFWFNFNALRVVWSLLVNHWDLVEKTYGFGSQYISVWVQVILQLYFNACLVQDILEMTSNRHYIPVKDRVERIISYCFASLAFPGSFLVSLNFWMYYSIRRDIIDEDDVMELYIPHWINHGLHTTIILLVCMEKIVVYRPSPSKIWGFLGVCSLIVLYAATCTLFYFISGQWPYPLVREMTNFRKFLLVVLNCLLGIFFMEIGEKMNRKIWGTEMSISSGKEEVKEKKTS